MASVFETNIEYLKGVGPQKAQLLNKELKIFTFGDLIQYYPFRYEDRTKIYQIKDITSDVKSLQIKGKITRVDVIGLPKKQRLVAKIRDESGEIELVWFKGINWIKKTLQPGVEYLIYGKPNIFNGKANFPHPEIEIFTPTVLKQYSSLQPIYHLTELLKKRFIDSKTITKFQHQLLLQTGEQIQESLPEYILKKYQFIDKKTALKNIHFPDSDSNLQKAQARLKFEELFYIQLKLFKEKLTHKKTYKGHVFGQLATLTNFYQNHLSFDLTGAQKRVIKEIRKDVLSGEQMNRLLQGDVGSGKNDRRIYLYAHGN